MHAADIARLRARCYSPHDALALEDFSVPLAQLARMTSATRSPSARRCASIVSMCVRSWVTGVKQSPLVSSRPAGRPPIGRDRPAHKSDSGPNAKSAARRPRPPGPPTCLPRSKHCALARSTSAPRAGAAGAASPRGAGHNGKAGDALGGALGANLLTVRRHWKMLPAAAKGTPI